MYFIGIILFSLTVGFWLGIILFNFFDQKSMDKVVGSNILRHKNKLYWVVPASLDFNIKINLKEEIKDSKTCGELKK